MKNGLKRRWACLLLCLLLCAAAAPGGCAYGSGPAEAEAELYSSALTPELDRLTADAGYIHQSFSSTIMDYEMTLAPEESEFRLTAWPVEREAPPTMEVWLDGGEDSDPGSGAEPWCRLSAGAPSPAIPVEAGQSREVTVRSTSCSGGNIADYTIEVYRAEGVFEWRLEQEKETAEGGRLLPVSLYAPAAMGLKTLSFALEFDPQVLSLATPEGAETEKLSGCVEAVDGFLYENPGKGYFGAMSPQLSNEAGLFRVSYGAKNNTVGKGSYTASESGELLTVYFLVRGELTAESLRVRESEEAPVKGISVVDGGGRAIQCAGLVSVKGLPDPPDVPDPPPDIPDPPDVPDPDPTVTVSALTPSDLLGEGAEARDGKGVLETAGGVITLTAADGNVEAIEEGTPITLTAQAGAGKEFVYWTLRGMPKLAAARSLAGDPSRLTENPLTVEAQKGISYTAVFEDAGENTAKPALGVLELERESLPGPAGLDQRFLVYTDADGYPGFGFQPGEVNADGSRGPGVFAYEVFLLPGEEAGLTLRSDQSVTAITAAGVTADDGGPLEIGLRSSQTGGSGGPQDPGDLSWWQDREGQRLKLALRDGDQAGTVTLTLGNRTGETTIYTLALHRVEKRPTITIGSSGGAVTATIADTQMRTAAFSLILTPEKAASIDRGEIWEEIRKSLSGSGLSVSDVSLADAAVTGAGLDGAKELRIVLDTKGDAAAEHRGETPALSLLDRALTVRLFEGSLSDILDVGKVVYNTVGDARFGGLFGVTELSGMVAVSGTILAYDARILPRVMLYEGGTPSGQGAAATVTLTAGKDESGRTAFRFTASLKAGVEYALTAGKEKHTDFQVNGVKLEADRDIGSLRMPAGDLDGDGRVTLADKNLLLSPGQYGKQADECDIDGDGFAALTDLHILMAPYNYGAGRRVMEMAADAGEGD